MKSTNELLKLKVSFQENAWAKLSNEISIQESLERIRSEAFKIKITELRHYLENENKAEYDKNKVKLPAVTFCATFNNKRQKDKLKSYNSIVVIDIDKLEKKELSKVWDFLLNDELIFTFWKSPSNKGIKGLISIQYDFELNDTNLDLAHKSAFSKLSDYFNNKYQIELDKSGSDTTRLCFFSYDSELILKDKYKPFEVLESDLLILRTKKTNKAKRVKNVSNQDSLYNPENRNNQSDRKTIGSIIKFMERKQISITHSYVNWYKVAMSIANSFTYDIGLKYFKRLSAIDKEKYDEINCINFLLNCYDSRNGSIKFNSLIHLANEKGYLTKQQKKKGSEVEG
ncbi:BT4734/BF3469 family protein [uncultured Kordia sp.]|uniref:BT4734/BF3469 family protein n=1 Tax=uncultured Kordia sp. TaxID=507699 RepID=UPI0026221365|nr:BT4734/BF3469 family protein [uncultured Kordia sp.]